MPAAAPESPRPQPSNRPSSPASGGHHGVFWMGLAILAATEVYLLSTAEVRDPLHAPLGGCILLLAALPSLLWARRGQHALPVFEVLLLTTANTYAFPLLNGHRELIFYTPEDISAAAGAVLLFQGLAILVYEITPRRPSNHAFWREPVISTDAERWLSKGIVLSTAYVLISTFTPVIPSDLAGLLRAIFFGVGIVCTFIMSRRLGEGRLSRGEKTFFLVNLLVQCLGMMATLFLVGAVSLLLLALVGYVSGSGKLPLVTCGLVLFAIAVLHNGKSEMRAKYWQDERVTPGLSELPAFFTEWAAHGLTWRDESEEKMTAKLIDRTSLFHILCLVVSTTPQQQPFLGGETYRDIPAQFLPRLLWPDKPLGNVSTSRLSVYYGLQTEEDTFKTTIGFGLISEGYANFGLYGVAAIAALLAFLIKKVQGWSHGAPLLTYGGLALVLLLAWSFQVEFTLSTWLASLYQATLAVLLLPFLLRRVFP